MNLPRFCFTLSMLAPAAVAFAAAKHPAEPTSPVLLAVAAPFVPPMHVGKPAVEAKPKSAGVAETLPDLPMPANTAFSIHTVLRYAATANSGPEESSSRFSVAAAPLPNAPGVSLLESSPLAWSARHVGAQHFNTEDGSSADAFAICYRLSKRSSVQVIPGDPAPVKIPVTSMANNMGVTVGMVVRLSKTR